MDLMSRIRIVDAYLNGNARKFASISLDNEDITIILKLFYLFYLFRRWMKVRRITYIRGILLDQ